MIRTKIPETKIQLAILHYLKYIGAYCGKTRTMGVKRGRVYFFDPYTFRGFPDVTFFYRNKLYFCEVKSKGNVQTAEQLMFETNCKSAGIEYILAYDVQDVIDRIEQIECLLN